MKKTFNINLVIYFFFCTLFIVFTTNYLSEYDLINTFGQKDIEHYYFIAKEAPLLPKNQTNIMAHVSSRFAVPYIAGILSNLSGLDLFNTYKIVNCIFFLFFLYVFYKFLQSTNFSFKGKILFFSLIFLNPYIVRYHVFNPVQTHDLLFFSLSLIFARGLVEKRFMLILLSSLLMIFIRQTSIAFLVGGLIYLIFEKNRNFKNIIIFLLLFIVFFKIVSVIGNSISTTKFDLRYGYGILIYDFAKLKELIKFLLLPLISFFPLIFLMFSGNKNKNEINKPIALSCLAISILMIAQPILGGPDWTQRNVMRITSLSYVTSVFFIFSTFNIDKLFRFKYYSYLFLIGLFAWSLHPLYSVSNFFDFLRF
jgi:hypothetical protein